MADLTLIKKPAWAAEFYNSLQGFGLVLSCLFCTCTLSNCKTENQGFQKKKFQQVFFLRNNENFREKIVKKMISNCCKREGGFWWKPKSALLTVTLYKILHAERKSNPKWTMKSHKREILLEVDSESTKNKKKKICLRKSNLKCFTADLPFLVFSRRLINKTGGLFLRNLRKKQKNERKLEDGKKN